MPENLNTTNVSETDPLDRTVARIQTADTSSEQLRKDINEAVGQFLKQKDRALVTENYENDLEGLLIGVNDEPLLKAQKSGWIREAQENYYNKKAQHCTEGAELSKHIVADPVMMFNGQYVHTNQDFSVNGAGIDFIFTRTYKNQAYYNGPLGFNWDHNYNLWLREEGKVIVRSSGELREDQYIKHEQYQYYVPPAGYHDIIEPYGNSFLSQTPSGVHFIYERIGQTTIHRIRQIRDRNDNYLSFAYDGENHLQRVEVNANDRWVTFQYDLLDRIISITTYPVSYTKQNSSQQVIRMWRYTYDDFGDLVAVTTPITDNYTTGLTTSYEYSSWTYPGELSHNLLRIIDPAEHLYLENEFGIQKGLLSYNRVIRQRQGGGEYHFEYEDVIAEQSWDYASEEIPAHRTILFERNGHPIEHVYNSLGNLIVKREQILNGCSIRELVSRYRYNKDGMMIASLSPEGTVIQFYYGREDFYRQPLQMGTQLEPWRDLNLTLTERYKFGNLLGMVKRSNYYSLSQMNLARGFYGNFFVSIFATNPEDVIVKTTYEPEYQQVISVSDPRYTQSVDPRHSEGVNSASPYNRHLTIFEYSSMPQKNLLRVKYPNTTFPSPLSNGSTGLASITDNYLQYGSNGRLERTQDPEGSFTDYVYFQGAQAGGARDGYLHKEIRDANNLKLTTTYEVNEAGNVTLITNPRNIQTTLINNELGQTIEMVSGGPGFRIKSSFDRNGLLERQERDNLDDRGQLFPEGNEVKTYKYDAQNNLIQEIFGSSNPVQQLITNHCYDSSDLRVETKLPRGNNIRYTYDERLLIKTTVRGASSASASTIRVFHDGDRQKVNVIDSLGNSTQYKYDALNRIVSITDALGNIKQNVYDKLNNIIIERFFERRSDGLYYLLSRGGNIYDERGNKIREIDYLFLAPIRTADFERAPEAEYTNALNQGLITQVNTQYFYDKNKRLFRVVNDKLQETTYEYDRMSRRVIERDNAGNYTQTFYDASSNIIRVDRHEIVRNYQTGGVVREDVFSIVNQYDDLDRRITTIDGLGNRTSFTYDSRNNLASVMDPLGNVKRYVYDIFNRKIKEIVEMTETGLGGGPRLADIVTQFAYDENHNLILVTDARKSVTQFVYDQLDRMVQTIYADRSSTYMEYDGNDNLIGRRDNNGLRVLLDVDPLNRILRIHLDKTGLRPGYLYPTGAEEFEEYIYDGLGRTLRQRNDFCEMNLTFDSLSRIYKEQIQFKTSYSSPVGVFVLSRTFDTLSNRTDINYPSGRAIHYDYDNLNRIGKIRNSNKGTNYPGSGSFPAQYDIAEYEYQGLKLRKATYGNKAGYELAYDGAGRLILMRHVSGGNLLLRMQQLYDGAGNRRYQRDNPAVAARPGGEVYAYDSLYRMTKFERKQIPAINVTQYEPPNVPLALEGMTGQQVINNAIGSLAQNPLDYTYKYDALGNREEEKQGLSPNVPYVANLLNQYENIDSIHFQYDLNGNLVDDGVNKYFYNYKNLLVYIQDKTTNTEVLRLAYDATGRLLAIRERTNVIHLINDGLNVIEEYSGGNVAIQYVYENGIDQRCQIVTSSEEWWYHYDLISSTRLLSNSSGQVPFGGRYEYDPFGSLVGIVTHNNPYHFGGKRVFKGIGLYDSRARQYSPVLGRFLQRDPKGQVDGPNLYVYGGNNPVSFIDSLGSEKEQKLSLVDSLKMGFEMHGRAQMLRGELELAYNRTLIEDRRQYDLIFQQEYKEESQRGISNFFGLGYGSAEDPIQSRVERRIGSKPQHYLVDVITLNLIALQVFGAFARPRVNPVRATTAVIEEEAVVMLPKKPYKSPAIRSYPPGNEVNGLPGIMVGDTPVYGPFFRQGSMAEYQPILAEKRLGGRGVKLVNSDPLPAAQAYTLEKSLTFTPGSSRLSFYTTTKPTSLSPIHACWSLERNAYYELIKKPGITAGTIQGSDAAFIDVLFPKVTQ